MENDSFAQRWRETSPVWQARKKREDEDKAKQYELLKTILDKQPQVFDTASLEEAVKSISEGRGFSLPRKDQASFVDVPAQGPATQSGDYPVSRMPISGQDLISSTPLPFERFDVLKNQQSADSRESVAKIAAQAGVEKAKIAAQVAASKTQQSEEGKNQRQGSTIIANQEAAKKKAVNDQVQLLTKQLANVNIPEEEKDTIRNAITIMRETGEFVTYEEVKQPWLKKFFNGRKFTTNQVGDNKPGGESGSKVKEVKRRTADGKIAVFDENTKKFLRYEGQ